MFSQVVTQILDALKSVPSSANTQPWTVLVVQGAQSPFHEALSLYTSSESVCKSIF